MTFSVRPELDRASPAVSLETSLCQGSSYGRSCSTSSSWFTPVPHYRAAACCNRLLRDVHYRCSRAACPSGTSRRGMRSHSYSPHMQHATTARTRTHQAHTPSSTRMHYHTHASTHMHVCAHARAPARPHVCTGTHQARTHMHASTRTHARGRTHVDARTLT
jgi:hypothetical protein